MVTTTQLVVLTTDTMVLGQLKTEVYESDLPETSRSCRSTSGVTVTESQNNDNKYHIY